MDKESTCQCRGMHETWVQFLGLEDPLEEDMATHSSILAWRILWTEEPGGGGGATVPRVAKIWIRGKQLSMHAHTTIGRESCWKGVEIKSSFNLCKSCIAF